jgi:DNA-binding response OmpR family regulator
VEDDDNIRELVVYALASVGYDALGYSDGAAFCADLQSTRPALVLLDIMLPGDDGIRILKRLRSSTHTKALPIIMLTAKNSEFDRIMGLDLGADDYITKPFSVLEVVSRVKAVLRRSSGAFAPANAAAPGAASPSAALPGGAAPGAASPAAGAYGAFAREAGKRGDAGGNAALGATAHNAAAPNAFAPEIAVAGAAAPDAAESNIAALGAALPDAAAPDGDGYGDGSAVVRVGEIALRRDRRTVHAGSVQVSLTYKEFELLYYLMANEGIVMSRDRLLNKIWGFDYSGETRTVDMHIKSLRQKLGDMGALIRTVRNVGYKIGG